MAALADGQLSLTEAAAITEFEDTPGALEWLLPAAGTRRFDHTVAQLRQERASADAEAQAAQAFRERGVTVLDQRPRAWDEACIGLRHLTTPDGHTADERAVTEPAHWAVLLFEDTVLQDSQTGELVDDDAVDWDTRDRPEATPAEGLRHARTVTDVTVFVPEYFCLDHRAAALTPDSRFIRYAGMNDTDSAAADPDPQDARDNSAAENAEAATSERRKVLALSRLGEATLRVRREFTTKLLARKTPPKGAARFVADCLARDSYLLTNHSAPSTTAALLGVDGPDAVAALVTQLPANGEGRAQVLTLALVLGALEARTSKDAWRNATPSWAHHVSGAEYVRWLADNGYTLAAVEEIVTGATTADEVYDNYVAAAATR